MIKFLILGFSFEGQQQIGSLAHFLGENILLDNGAGSL